MVFRPRRSFPWLFRITLISLLVALAMTTGALVMMLRSQADETAQFRAGAQAAEATLVTTNDGVFGPLDAVDPVRPDLGAVLVAVEEASATLAGGRVPRTAGRYAEEAEALRQAFDAEHQFLIALHEFAMTPVAATSAKGTQVKDRWRGVVDASRGLANRQLHVGFQSLTPRLESTVDLVVARANELREAGEISAQREATRAAQRTTLQSYHDDMVDVFARYEALRDELQAFNEANARVETAAQYQAFRVMYGSGSSGRAAIASQFRSISPPPVFSAIHAAFPPVLDRLARAVNDARTAADEAFNCFNKPCPPVFETPAFKAYVVAGNALFEEYSRLRTDWERLYEGEVRRLNAP